MYNMISFLAGRNENRIKKMNKKADFEVNPLDVNIAKMQYNLLSRLEREMPENGDFAPVIEQYFSKDPTLNLSEIKVTCSNVKDKSAKNTTRALEVLCSDKSGSKEIKKLLAKGSKKDILEYLNTTDFFAAIKNTVKTKF